MSKTIATPTVILAALLSAGAGSAQNLVSNGDFDTSLTGWEAFSQEPFWQSEDWQSDQSSGSARIPDQLVQGSGNNVYLTQCIALDGASQLVVQAAIQSTSVDGATGAARIALSFRDGLDCNQSAVVGDYTFAIEAPDVAPWTLQTSDPIPVPQGAVAAVLQLISVKLTATGGWLADFDAVFVPEPGAGAGAGIAACALAQIARRRRASAPGRHA